MDSLGQIRSYVESCVEDNWAQGREALRAVDRFIKIHANRWKRAKMDPGHPQVVTDLKGVFRVGVIFLLFKFVCNSYFIIQGESSLF